eukprot:CAMPEP_0177652608 /NCGR_PEP_ID=MMETSP0447-20121125/13229_1 /TAXON_ID=0 /ORGANISM="Stygamoeba regulata, Strain BSH-02190019" /LENGTH=115 /DNA_ID=CAMNT_0019155881 /DNA_START=185 /DNA_END=529 /DNA_ORIENTATION=+
MWKFAILVVFCCVFTHYAVSLCDVDKLNKALDQIVDQCTSKSVGCSNVGKCEDAIKGLESLEGCDSNCDDFCKGKKEEAKKFAEVCSQPVDNGQKKSSAGVLTPSALFVLTSAVW